MRKIDETKCIEPVYNGIGQFRQCLRKRGHGLNGEYCRAHDPAAVKARDGARQAKFDAEMAARNTAQTLGRLLIDAGCYTEDDVKTLLEAWTKSQEQKP